MDTIVAARLTAGNVGPLDAYRLKAMRCINNPVARVEFDAIAISEDKPTTVFGKTAARGLETEPGIVASYHFSYQQNQQESW